MLHTLLHVMTTAYRGFETPIENSLLPLEPFSPAICSCSANPRVLRSVACSSSVPAARAWEHQVRACQTRSGCVVHSSLEHVCRPADQQDSPGHSSRLNASALGKRLTLVRLYVRAALDMEAGLLFASHDHIALARHPLHDRHACHSSM